MLFIKRLYRHLFTPITIMIIPHTIEKTYRFRIPSIGVMAICFFWCLVTAYMVSLGIQTKDYSEIKQKYRFYESQFVELKATIHSFRETESKFKKIFVHHQNKEEVYKNLDLAMAMDDTGSIDIEMLKKQTKMAIENITGIKEYLKHQKGIFYATPVGSPVPGGRISSDFGWRTHPVSQRNEYHTGMDIAVASGSTVHATADGIVSFAGWSGGSGYLVVVEHGLGFTTCYAHNQKIAVKVGQEVKRGDTVSFVGSTGNTTGPHVHYEVWINGKPVDPSRYVIGEKDV